MSDDPRVRPGADHSAIDQCWNVIGVRGDGSCVQLERHVHCRNCPVYSAAARRVLDCDVPAGYLAERTIQVAAQPDADELGPDSVLIFRIGTEWLALPTSMIEEVADRRPIHALPHRRNGVVLGLTNVRGELLVCVALEHVLGLEQDAPASGERTRRAHPRLLVVRRDGARAVFPVDEVRGTHRIHGRDLAAVPATVAKAVATHTRTMLSWQQKSVGILDEELLLSALDRGMA
jgi:chemotaxis-related protein WspD